MNHPEKVTEEFLICKKCCQNRSLKSPTTLLSCGHVICLTCATDCNMKDKQDCYQILCPICCLPTVLPLRGPTQLPRSLYKEKQMDHLLRRNNAALGRQHALYCIEKFCLDPETFYAQL
ncbi:hypothetical protein HELRODRAFT_161752 [Helobdella robusta]|uniref:RING-type domain-containing protein n=1 Tax=Helobdella robusta TaxID=6412 RepID=T1ERV4_HELRO|nr:hypothetical protein HELRODRAFT_161752 [Helobdella robusta]ESO02479.1 hypothetical protein HELRODRAFT_161752 [Helobdella robusta]